LLKFSIGPATKRTPVGYDVNDIGIIINILFNLYIIYSKYTTPIKLQCSFAFLDSRYVTLVGICWNGTGKSKEKVNSLESYQVQIQSKLNQKH